MGSSKTTGARKHQKTCLEIVLYSKIDFELASKQKCPHKEESLFLKFPFFCIPSEQSNWVSCHAPLFWLQEKNFFVLITRKSRGKNFFCAGWVFVHCNNSGGCVSADGFTPSQASFHPGTETSLHSVQQCSVCPLYPDNETSTLFPSAQ